MTIKLLLKSLDKTTIKLYTVFIKTILKKLKIRNFTIQNLLQRTKRLSLLKSPHVNKKAFEQFEIKLNKTVITIKNLPYSALHLTKFVINNKPKSIFLKSKFIT
jgi:ribosomal protein S10